MRSLKTIVTLASLVASTSVLTACIGAPECESEGRYMLSQEGQRIQAPEDLDNLESYKEMTIPHASPRAPRDESEKCVEAPPAIQSSQTS